jgi:Protein of unknown function (DUF1573)
MLRYSLVLLAGLWAAGPAAAATWADAMFDELSKDFGSVPRGPTLTHPFRVVNKTQGPVSISGVRVSCGCVSATVLKPWLNPGEETAVVARMDTARFLGVRTVTIYVQFNRPAFEEVRLWVQANARDDFNLYPDALAFGQVRRGSTPTASAQITFYGHSDAQVIEVRAESNYIQPAVREVRRLDSEVTYELSARLRGDVPVGKWYTDMWLRTNNPTLPQVRVPLTVEIESALSVSPEAVTLGQVRLRGESERRVIVRGVKPFKITRIQGTDDQVLVRDSTAESKSVHVLTVKLRAAQPGELLRTLRVLTDLPDDGKIDFQVSALVMP